MTPTPWKICTYRPFRIIARGAKESTYAKGDDKFAALCEVHGTFEQQRANASFIVEACNSHARLLAENAALVKALTEARGLLDEAAEPDYNQMAAEWDRAAQAHIRVIDAALALHRNTK